MVGRSQESGRWDCHLAPQVEEPQEQQEAQQRHHQQQIAQQRLGLSGPSPVTQSSPVLILAWWWQLQLLLQLPLPLLSPPLL